MILIAAVDDRNGMTFNGRRLSQDRVLRARILEEVREKGSRLWMNAYTRKLFADPEPEEEAVLMTDDGFLSNTPAGDYCYVENSDVLPYEDRMEEIWLCLWNRRYPADTYWPIDMSGWSLFSAEEFAGSSHEKITINRYCRAGGES